MNGLIIKKKDGKKGGREADKEEERIERLDEGRGEKEMNRGRKGREDNNERMMRIE